MSAVPVSGGLTWRQWWPLLIGICIALLSSYTRFYDTIWEVSGNEHAPILIAIAIFLFWRHRDAIAQATPPVRSYTGVILLAVGLLCYLFGVRTKIAFFESLSHVVLVSSAILLAGGPALLKRLWFALLFLALSLPIPGYLLSMATEGLKAGVTTMAVETLYDLGLPIAREGAVITIGNYQLLVAEACAGMNSIISLSAVGLLYLYLAPSKHLWQLGAALASIVPIAMAANVLRIVILSVITFYFGDEAGQGFLHEFAGIVMFLFALVALVGLTWLLGKLEPKGKKAQGVIHA